MQNTTKQNTTKQNTQATKAKAEPTFKQLYKTYKQYFIQGKKNSKRVKFIIPITESKITQAERKIITAYLQKHLGKGKAGCATFKVGNEFRIFIQNSKIKQYSKLINHSVKYLNQ